MIFVGQALEVNERPDRSTKVTVKFLVMSSWRGAEVDTLTVRITNDAGCALFSEGERYLVHADLAAAGKPGPRLVSGPCDESTPIGWERVRDSIAALGPPRWTAPPFGERAIDRYTVPLGAELYPEPDEGDVSFLPPDDPAISRIEIGNFRGKQTPAVRSMHLKPGLYQ
ncbi:MAG: hypothetical protein IT357_11815, partial [Gemmatimonadaceae bacterium]|nr:hypothetical protein [Gemmatimonadaceae bacterium]